MLLQKHSTFRATNRDELDDLLRTMASGAVRAARPIDDKAGFQCNAVLSDTMQVFSLSCGFAATFDFEPFDDLRLVFQTRSTSRVVFGNDKIDIGPHNGSYILPVDTPVTEFHPSGYCSFAVRIKPAELQLKLNALCGEEHQQQIRFAQPDPSDERFLRFVRQPLFAAARELDAADPAFHRNLLEDIRAVTHTRLLLFAPHNFSNILAPQPNAPSRSQLRLAEDYIAANWDKALDVIALADAVGVSARTILRYFRDSYGETPRDYLKRIRLDHARAMLCAGGEATTVIAVALRCGFSSLGNFAGSYRRRFGELPSDTLKKIA